MKQFVFKGSILLKVVRLDKINVHHYFNYNIKLTKFTYKLLNYLSQIGGEVLDKFRSLKSNISSKMNRSNVDLLVGIPLITQMGKKKIIIENYKSIIGFLEYEVKVNTSIGTLKIYGDKMTMTEMTSETIIIEGVITKVEIV